MSLNSWLTSLKQSSRRNRKATRRHGKLMSTRKMFVEGLEDRRSLAVVNLIVAGTAPVDLVEAAENWTSTTGFAAFQTPDFSTLWCNGGDGGGYIEQTVSTIADVEHTLTFDWNVYGYFGAASGQIRATVHDTNTGTQIADSGLFSTNVGKDVFAFDPWATQSFTFTPTVSSIAVRFTGNQGIGGCTTFRYPASTLVTNIVLTVNNEGPTITSDGGGDTANVNVAENQTAVTDVQANDDSDAEGAGIVYSLSGGADQSSFSIDANTGVLTFNTAPDFENPTDAGLDNVYDVQVTVTDSGLLTDVQDIAVTVDDVNETPVVANLIGDVMANEDQLDSVLDLTNTFSDPDAGDNLTLTATSADGALVTATMVGTDLVLDYQLNQSGTTTVTVRATDSGGLYVEDTLTVTVVSANDQFINLIDCVNKLKDDGVLNNGNANALNSKLGNAQSKVNAGNLTPAVNQLNAFRNQVEAFRSSGKLTDDQADELIEKLDALLTSLLEE